MTYSSEHTDETITNAVSEHTQKMILGGFIPNHFQILAQAFKMTKRYFRWCALRLGLLVSPVIQYDLLHLHGMNFFGFAWMHLLLNTIIVCA